MSDVTGNMPAKPKNIIEGGLYDLLTVEAKTCGKCVSRNGSYDICSIRLTLSETDVVDIGFVSERLKRQLHSGAKIDAKAMDSLALQWVKKRGLLGKSGNQIKEMTTELTDRIQALKDARGMVALVVASAKAIDKILLREVASVPVK